VTRKGRCLVFSCRSRFDPEVLEASCGRTRRHQPLGLSGVNNYRQKNDKIIPEDVMRCTKH
jgi:hypothetical protein